MQTENKAELTMGLVAGRRVLRLIAQPWAVYVAALLAWAASVAVVGIVVRIFHQPLWLIPLCAAGIGLLAVKDWKRFRQYSPLFGGYGVATALFGYGWLNQIGSFNLVTWSLWLVVVYIPPDWIKRRYLKQVN